MNKDNKRTKEENILLINICKEKLHFYEFVKPVGKVLIKNKIKGFIRHYTCLNKKDLDKASRGIICGTSLRDNEFLDEIKRFNWIRNFKKPLLGICGGMQLIGMVFGGKLDKKSEVGYFYENFSKEFLGLKNKVEVYHLHNNYVNFNKLKDSELNDFENNGLNDFEVVSESRVGSDSKINQAVKHKKRKIYGVLFHPEVRNKELIKMFLQTM